MPKFSAYMRGEKGIQGETGQASLLDGIVDGYNNLPNKAGLAEDRNYVYYVKENDGIHLYIYKGGSGEEWQHLGVVTAGFSTTQYASASTKEWFPGVQPDVTITPHEAQQTTGLKSFDFHFDIPASQPAGFSTNQPTSVTTLNWDESATVEITPDENSPDWEKSFLFKFGIPHGREAGFSTTQKANATILSWTEDPTVSITTDENSPFYSKVYNFEFGIPQGEPAGFGTLSTSITTLNHLSTATFEIEEGGTNKEKDLTFKLGIPAAHPAGFSTVAANAYDLEWNENPEASITTSGNDWEKNFDFSFGIPHGRPAGFSTEMEVSVTTLPSTNIKNKNGNIVQIEKTENNEAKIKNIKINIEPQQDLHGQSNPYPAGGGKNLFDISSINTATQNGIAVSYSGNTISYSGTAVESGWKSTVKVIDLPAGTWHFHLETTGTAVWLQGYTAKGADFTATISETTTFRLSMMNATAGQSYSGTVTNIQIESGSSYSDFAPYSNICPISGWTQAVVTRTGINLWDEQWEVGDINNDTGQTQDSNQTWRCKNYISIIPNTSYYFVNPNSYNIRYYFYDKDKNFISSNIISTGPNANHRLNSPSNAYYLKVRGTGTNPTYQYNVSVNYPLSEEDYHAGHVQSLTIDLDGTRYGGTLDVLTGKMTVTHEKKTFDGSTGGGISISYSSDGSVNIQDNNYRPNFNGYVTGVSCDTFKVVFSDTNWNNTTVCTRVYKDSSWNYTRFYIKGTGATTSEEAIAWVSAHPVTYIRPLATPLTVTLSPSTLSLLLGESNIWADTGNIDIDYSVINDAYVNVTPDESTPDYAKKFNFEFGIPNGVPGGFGNISVSTQQVDPATPASVSITTSGPEFAKNFDFLFKIPQGKNASSAGGVAGVYVKRTFTSTNIDSTSTLYWNNNILYIKNPKNNTIPICIINNQNQNIASTFKIDKENENILYYSDSSFDGSVYLIAESVIPEFIVHSVSTVSNTTPASVEIGYLDDDLSMAFLNFSIPKGEKGDTALSIDKINVNTLENIDDEPYAEVTTDINKKIEMTFYLPRGLNGEKGEKGDSALTIDGINVYSLSNDVEPYATTHISESSAIIDFYLPKGDKGDQGDIGVGISSINNLGTIGLTTTYQINYTSTNITPTTFEVINGSKGDQGEPGKGITSINNLGTVGLTTTYQINYGEGLSTAFEVINGEQGPQGEQGISIKSILKTDTNETTREDTYTITFTDNSTTTYIIKNGEKGDKGDTALTISNISITTLAANETIPYANVTTDANHDVSINFHLPKGATGVGIASITKGISNGLIDNYTINYTDGTNTTFQVTNGNGINSITFNSLSENGNVYNVNYSNGTIDTILAPKGPQGEQGIQGIQGLTGTLEINSGITGILPIENGGTSATTPELALNALGISFTTNDIGTNQSLSTGQIILVYEE